MRPRWITGCCGVADVAAHFAADVHLEGFPFDILMALASSSRGLGFVESGSLALTRSFRRY